MFIVDNFENEIDIVLKDLNRIVHNYPEPFNEYGLKLLEKMRLLPGSSNRTCESYMLIPFWLRESFSIDDSTCLSISTATIFSVLYFMTQDEVIDEKTDEKNQILLLSSMFYNDFIKRYHEIFKPRAAFWDYFDNYLGEWRKSVLWEKSQHFNKIKPYSGDELILLARKTSGIKIPFAAVCCFSSNENFIEHFSKMVDYDQIVYQFFDDFRDWEKDLKNGNYTYLLVEAIKYLGLKEIKGVENLIRILLLDDNFLLKYFQKSYEYNQLSYEAVRVINNPYINEYIKEEAKICILNPFKDICKLNYGIGGNLGRYILETKES